MRSRNWFWGVGIALGGGTAFLLFKLVQLFLLCAGNVAPRLMERWTPAIDVVGGGASGLLGLVVLLFLARAANGPALLRRMGGSIGALGSMVALSGMILFLMPHKPPVHPGRMPAGDVAAGAIAYFVFLVGITLIVVAILVVISGLGWSWLRRRREVTV